MAKLTKTSIPGVFRRHVQGCPNADGEGRCDCNYAVPKRHRGRQHMETYPTFEEARVAKGKKDAGETRPKSKTKFGAYFDEWIDTYSGRTKRGFEEETRTEYRRSIEAEAMPLWEQLPLSEIGTREVRQLYARMRKSGKSHAAMQKVRAALSPLFNTAIEDEEIRVNPVTGVVVPVPPKAGADDESEERGKAMTAEELNAFLRAVHPDWHLFFEFLAVTGLRIGEAVGLTWKNLILSGEKPQIRVREQIYEGRRKRYLKSDAGKRDIPLSADMVRRLLEHRRDHFQGPRAPVFATASARPTGRPISIAASWRPLRSKRVSM